ncbi:GNAT family N-acetyltransferase [Kribbella kalugense]|uniref:Acetyltransferase (GNAT) family protein n=1 Tax=Kribbella kalugense TaxID=2512221 RepID=A0A4R7ZM67_9ACTN|nr:GNAT family N-acetyltransferase [Kribbella kalugense]TDW17711.1 acetyltransferase (GNAT) family protein [Kribbella kalugense]
MDQEFIGEIIEWRGPAPYYFVPVPEQESDALRAAASAANYGWGLVPIHARMGSVEWKTSLWPKDGEYLLPLKDAVRKPAGLDAGDTVEVRLTFEAARRKQKQPATQRVRAPRPLGSREPVTAEQLVIVPANEAAWEDLRAVFGASSDPSRCSCQRFRMLPKESWDSEGPEELAARLRDQTSCGNPKAPTTSGLVAYLDGEPVGWCAVAPRADHPRLLRDFRVPWLGRDEDRTDATVWAVTCFVTRAGYRRRGIGRALASATVAFARDRGARAVEGYPDLVDGGSVGTLAMFTEAGYTEVNRPGKRRAVMRIDF